MTHARGQLLIIKLLTCVVLPLGASIRVNSKRHSAPTASDVCRATCWSCDAFMFNVAALRSGSHKRSLRFFPAMKVASVLGSTLFTDLMRKPFMPKRLIRRLAAPTTILNVVCLRVSGAALMVSDSAPKRSEENTSRKTQPTFQELHAARMHSGGPLTSKNIGP